jgi:hypothetical protein
MKTLLILTALSSSLPFPLMAQLAGQLVQVYNQPMEGVYSQGWSAQVLGERQGTGIEVYVVGDGKLGDFFGVISVDCTNPQFSRWLAIGGYVTTDSVPVEAIRGIRRLAC